jgi:predicted DNA-binding protein (MmcQ/YjbR family)
MARPSGGHYNRVIERSCPMASTTPDAVTTPAAERRVRRVVERRISGFDETTTWDHPTFRLGGQIFAVLHDRGLLLRCTTAEATEYLRDDRFTPAPYWGRFGWVCIDIGTVDDAELAQLVSDAAGRITRRGRR